jgi:2-(1,2-epoxy-1,2-dihydrophenyl)acetyl-CoA isomerase
LSQADELELRIEDGVARLTLNCPDVLNSLSPAMLKGIPAKLLEAVDLGARCVLIDAAGRAFCTGARLDAANARERRDLGQIIDEFYNPLAMTMAELPIPIVSAVQGPAAGAGVSLALGADIIVAARSAYFMLAFSGIGLVPDAGATWLVANAVGRVKALELMLLGEKMSAEDAHAAGLITRLVEDEALPEAALSLATKLAKRPTQALGLIRRQVRSAIDSPLEQALAVERENQRTSGFSEDFAEGVIAFKEKRTPNFKGR